MVKLMLHPDKVLTFCLSAAVGHACPNLPADVEFVRFGIFAIRRHLLASGSSAKPYYTEFMSISSIVATIGGCDERLVAAIRAFQQSQEAPVDGVVSVMTPGRRSSSGRAYTHAQFETAMVVEYPNLYPRIDMVPESGQIVSGAVAKLFRVSSDPSGKGGMVLK